LGQLDQLAFLDLSNNKLRGPFPAWIHNLRRLALLNLGQNNIYGEIPLFIGEERNDGHRLTNLRDFISLITSDRSFRQRLFYDRLDLNAIKIFYRKHFWYLEKSKDLLWINPSGTPSTPMVDSELQETIDKYVIAQDRHLMTKVFQTVISDPPSFIENMHLLQQSQQ
jgi:hypothetical protein